MSAYNEPVAVANHTAAHLKISRQDRRINDLQRMVNYLRNRIAELEEAATIRAQAERHFK